ncbi:hypothetical protein V8G54_019762 [Vigna mungo]|uniref:Uncharacterized protein n=1 Tax=Vigna mungo TaxID=3915 RepID=A0AAQ3NBE2_VIGMU
MKNTCYTFIFTVQFFLKQTSIFLFHLLTNFNSPLLFLYISISSKFFPPKHYHISTSQRTRFSSCHPTINSKSQQKDQKLGKSAIFFPHNHIKNEFSACCFTAES